MNYIDIYIYKYIWYCTLPVSISIKGVRRHILIPYWTLLDMISFGLDRGSLPRATSAAATTSFIMVATARRSATSITITVVCSAIPE